MNGVGSGNSKIKKRKRKKNLMSKNLIRMKKQQIQMLLMMTMDGWNVNGRAKGATLKPNIESTDISNLERIFCARK